MYIKLEEVDILILEFGVIWIWEPVEKETYLLLMKKGDRLKDLK